MLLGEDQENLTSGSTVDLDYFTLTRSQSIMTIVSQNFQRISTHTRADRERMEGKGAGSLFNRLLNSSDNCPTNSDMKTDREFLVELERIHFPLPYAYPSNLFPFGKWIRNQTLPCYQNSFPLRRCDFNKVRRKEPPGSPFIPFLSPLGARFEINSYRFNSKMVLFSVTITCYGGVGGVSAAVERRTFFSFLHTLVVRVLHVSLQRVFIIIFTLSCLNLFINFLAILTPTDEYR